MILYNTAYGFFIQNNTAFTNLKIHSLAFEIQGLLQYNEPTVLDQQHHKEMVGWPNNTG